MPSVYLNTPQPPLAVRRPLQDRCWPNTNTSALICQSGPSRGAYRFSKLQMWPELFAYLCHSSATLWFYLARNRITLNAISYSTAKVYPAAGLRNRIVCRSTLIQNLCIYEYRWGVRNGFCLFFTIPSLLYTTFFSSEYNPKLSAIYKRNYSFAS